VPAVRPRDSRWSAASAAGPADSHQRPPARPARRALPAAGAVCRPVCRGRSGAGRSFSPQRGVGHCPVPTQPLPVHAHPFLTPFHAGWPPLQKDARGHPCLQAIVGRGRGAPLGLVPGVPLAARPQDVKESLGAVAIRHARPATAEAGGVHAHWEQQRQHRPQCIGNAESSGGAVVRAPRPRTFGCRWHVHAGKYTRLFG
jgi:hypothetical protein